MADKDIKALGMEDLNKELIDLRREQFNLRMQRGSGQLSSPARFKVVRRQIARIKTRLTELASTQ
ncbi:MAG: 50S ribosomal protein L29 [marine bacterium B5-7]|nr:MAG: 50S ribosomal protein L29 [marine bacterium B5-7]